MNIWLLQTGEILPLKPGIRKLRTAYLVDELIQRGHSIIWWASAFDHFEKKWLFPDDTEVALHDTFTIRALKGVGYRKNISLSRFIDHRIIAKKFKKAATSLIKPDVIVASLPAHDLAYEAAVYAEKCRIPFLIDIRDPWPDIFLDHVPFLPNHLLRMILHKDFRMVKKTMKSATGVISMMNTFLDWGLKYAERDQMWKDKVFHLGYKRNIVTGQLPEKIERILKKLHDTFVVTFIGTFAEYHNPSILLECAAILLNDSRIHFVLAGDGQLMPQIKKSSLSLPNLTLTGWLEQAEISALLQQSHVGVCTTNQFIKFFPNKAFAYFSAGLPIISAFQGELKETIENYQVGLYYSPNDVKQLIHHITRLADDPIYYQKMSENAIHLFNEKFDADKIYKEYADHIENIVKNGFLGD